MLGQISVAADQAPIAISLVSLGVSLLVAYRAELRGPQMSIRLRKPPGHWQVSPARHTAGRPPGYASLALFDEASWIQIVGQCQATVDNDGPKGGAVWDVAMLS